MKTIWKEKLAIVDVQHVLIPFESEILTVQIQNGEPYIWFLCDEKRLKNRKEIRICGTGHPVPDNIGRYIGTFQLYDLGLVFHVFEGD